MAVPAPAAGDGHVGTRAGLAPRLLRLALHNLPTYRFYNLVTGVTSITAECTDLVLTTSEL